MGYLIAVMGFLGLKLGLTNGPNRINLREYWTSEAFVLISWGKRVKINLIIQSQLNMKTPARFHSSVLLLRITDTVFK